MYTSSGEWSTRRRAHRFGDAQGVAADHSHGNPVDHVVDVADDCRRGGVEQRFQLALLGRLHRAQQHRRIAERALHGLHRISVVGVERAELLGDRLRVGAERADVPTY